MNLSDPVLPAERVRKQWIERACQTKALSHLVTASECPDMLNPKVIINDEELIDRWVKQGNNPQLTTQEHDGRIVGEEAIVEEEMIAPYVDWVLAEKTRAAGFYLLKDVLNPPFQNPGLAFYPQIYSYSQDFYGKDLSDDQNSIQDPFDPQDAYGGYALIHVLPAFAPIEVFKKGENLFQQPSLQVEEEEDNPGNPDTLLNKISYNLICGTDRGEISGEFFFIPPRLFDDMKPLCQGLSENGPKAFRVNLFKKPVVFNDKPYESAYMVLEELIRERFTSRETLQASFEDRAAPLAEEVSEGLIQDFRNIVDNFLMEKLVNQKASGILSPKILLVRYDIRQGFGF